MCNQQSLRSACAYAQSDQSLCLSLEYSRSVKLLTEHHLEFLSLKGGCTGSSKSTLVKMTHCWKSHVKAYFVTESTKNSCASLCHFGYLLHREAVPFWVLVARGSSTIFGYLLHRDAVPFWVPVAQGSSTILGTCCTGKQHR